MSKDTLYSDRSEERRKQFNKIIGRLNLILCNNIPGVDPSIFENWEGDDPTAEDEDGDYGEVMQWFLCSRDDAEFLKRHNQYITYSDLLNVSVLAITHFGTGWDYTSMVDDFEDCYTGLENFSDEGR